jgi:hypothetical protein
MISCWPVRPRSLGGIKALRDARVRPEARRVVGAKELAE